MNCIKRQKTNLSFSSEKSLKGLYDDFQSLLQKEYRDATSPRTSNQLFHQAESLLWILEKLKRFSPDMGETNVRLEHSDICSILSVVNTLIGTAISFKKDYQAEDWRNPITGESV